jgi:crossover junction endodeoxyribonuclease RusA
VIILSLPFPPSMNRLWRATKGGKVYRSPDYQKWKEVAAWEARLQAKTTRISGKFKLSVRFVKPDARHRDLDNLLKSLLDCLQSAGVVANDKNCDWIDARWVPDGPPCELTLEELSDG